MRPMPRARAAADSRAKPVGAAEFGRYGGRIGDVVTVCGALRRGQDRGQVEVRNAQRGKVVQHRSRRRRT